MSKVIVISNTNELVRVKPERVVYVESDGDYSTRVLHNEDTNDTIKETKETLKKNFPEE